MGNFIYILSVTILFLVILLLDKREEAISLLSGCVTSILAIMTYTAIITMLMTAISIPVNLISMGTVNILTAVLIGIYIIKTHKVQKIIIDKIEIIAFVILSLVLLGVELKVFSWSLRHSFNNEVDPANHFRMAMNIVRNEKVSGMYFSALFNSVIINICSPFLEEIKLYKGLIVGITLQNWIGILMFYVLVVRTFKTKKKKLIGIVVTILFWMGYPLYSYIGGNFVYWEMGVILIEYMIFLIYELMEGRTKAIYCIIGLGMALYSLGVCYIQFVPIAFGAFLIVFLMYLREKGISMKIIIAVCMVLLILSVVGGGISYYYVFINNNTNIFKAFQGNGGIYREFYRDFVFFVPPIVYLLLKDIRNRKCSIFGLFFIITIGYISVMYVLVTLNYVSTYYYMKNYYILWMLVWLGIAQFIGSVNILNKDKIYIVSYLMMIGCVVLISFGELEEKFYGFETEKENEKSLLGIYEYNVKLLSKDWEDSKYSTDKFALMQYVMDNLNDSKEPVVFLMTSNCKGDCYWYEAITQQDSRDFWQDRWDDENTEELSKLLADKNIQYFVVLKSSQVYGREPEYFEKYEWLYENEAGIVAKVY